MGQSMFQLLREVNQMERKTCPYLDWELNVEPQTLSLFKDMVRKDFARPGPYPELPLQGPQCQHNPLFPHLRHLFRSAYEIPSHYMLENCLAKVQLTEVSELEVVVVVAG